MMKALYLIFTALVAVVIVGCSNSNAKPSVLQPDQQSAAIESPDDTPKSNYSYAQPADFVKDELSPNLDAAIAVLKGWNQCHNERTTAGLDRLYSHVCLYYGNDQPRDIIIDSKRSFFAKHPQYQQYVDNIEITNWGESFVDVSFTKRVKMAPDSEWQTYQAYLRLIGGSEDEWYISWEGDTTTDANIGRRERQNPPGEILVDNTTPLTVIFNDKNVGKEISTSYWDLVGVEGEPVEGPLAKAISQCNTIGARNTLEGKLRKGLRGNKDILYVGGTCSGGSYTTRVLWIYDKSSRNLSVYPEF